MVDMGVGKVPLGAASLLVTGMEEYGRLGWKNMLLYIFESVWLNTFGSIWECLD